MRSLLLLGWVIFFTGCGPVLDEGPDALATSSSALVAALCGDQPVPNPDGSRSTMGCPFQQQEYNVRTNGLRLSVSAVAFNDASEQPVGRFTLRCDHWLLGQDAQGVTVIVNELTGEVRSHGAFHPGQPLSTLANWLETPLSSAP